jgi:hypothetical protein
VTSEQRRQFCHIMPTAIQSMHEQNADNRLIPCRGMALSLWC